MAVQAYFCARFDIDTIFTPWRTANWVSLFGDAELEYLPRAWNWRICAPLPAR